jgi:methyl-accepting chemotaxis protein
LINNVERADGSIVASKTLHDLRTQFGRQLLLLLWILLFSVTIIAVIRGVWPMLIPVIGVVLVGSATAFWLRDPIGLLTRYISSVATSGIVALLVLEFEWQFIQADLHIAFFVGLAVVALWCCWASILIAGATAVLHHLILNFVYPFGIFPDGPDLWRVLLHVAFLLSEVILLGWLVNRLVIAFKMSDAATAKAQNAQAVSIELAEKRRIVMTEQQEQRAKIEAAVGLFRERVNSIVQIVGESAHTLRSTASALSDSANQATQHTESAVRTANNASTNVKSSAAAAEKLMRSNADISRQLGQTIDVVQNAANEALISNTEIIELSQATQKIGNVVKLIRDIAEQTNLLALNATIEAARAGQAGKGFGVVASEVKLLATQSGKATEEIAAQVLAVQNSANDTIEAINRITSRMQEISQYTSAVAASVENQNVVTDEISNSVTIAAEGAKAIASVIGEVVSAASETHNSAQTVLTASEIAEAAAINLRNEIKTFLQDVAA